MRIFKKQERKKNIIMNRWVLDVIPSERTGFRKKWLNNYPWLRFCFSCMYCEVSL